MTNSKKPGALAPIDNFTIASRFEGMDPELLAELHDEMEDLDADSGLMCRQIKIPSGGGLAFEVEGDGDNVEYLKELTGVIILTHRTNGYWPAAYGSEENEKIPVCSSLDGKTGVNTETGEVGNCDTCPFNQFGSAPGGAGKACKNMRRLYMMFDGDPNLYMLSVPPTSIKEVNKRLMTLVAQGIPHTGLIVSLRLEKALNAGGVAYSRVILEKQGLLPDAAAAKARALRAELKTQLETVAVGAAEYVTEPNITVEADPDPVPAPAPAPAPQPAPAAVPQKTTTAQHREPAPARPAARRPARQPEPPEPMPPEPEEPVYEYAEPLPF